MDNHWFEQVRSPWTSNYSFDGYEYQYSARFCDTGQCLWWRECGAENSGLPADYVLSLDKEYLLKIERDVNGGEMCCELDPKTANKTGYCLLPKSEMANNEFYNIFASFEDIQNIEVYKNPTSQHAPIKIKLPRYGLEWEVQEQAGKLKYTWKNNPDYKLMLEHPDVIDGFPNMLYMTNEKTYETIAVVPRLDFIPQRRATGLSAMFGQQQKTYHEYMPIEYDISASGLHKQYDVFTVNKHGVSGETALSANSVEEYLQLAFLFFANRDAENAMLALRQVHKLGLHGTLEEVHLIKKIMTEIPKGSEIVSEAVVNNPETLAVKLYVAFLLGEQQQVSLKKLNAGVHNQKDALKKFYYEDFASITRVFYQDYCKVQGNVPEHLQLNLNQRKSLLHQMVLDTAALKNEKLLLDFITAKEEKKYYSKKHKQLAAQDNLHDADKSNLSATNDVLIALNENIKVISDKIKLLNNETNKQDIISLFNTDFIESLEAEHEFIDMSPILLSFVEEKNEATELDKTIKAFRQEISKINRSLEAIVAINNGKQNFLDKQNRRNALEVDRGLGKNAIVKEKNKKYHEFLTDSLQDDLNKHLTKRILDEKAMNLLEDAIVFQANRLLVGPSRKFFTATQETAGIKNKLKFEDLIYLYLQGDKNLFAKKTRIQDANELDVIYLKIHEYLLASTANLQNIRILKALKGLEPDAEISVSALAELPFAPIKDDEKLIKLGDQLSATREYQASEHPEILLFEHYENMLLRAEQSETLVSLLEKEGDGFKNKIVQLIMGFGKSKVLLPLMALKRANGTNLSMIEIPQSLFGPGFKDLSSKTMRLFGKKGFALLFDRDANTSADNFKRLLDGLLDAVRNRDYVASTPESICSLELKYLELLSKEEPEEGLSLTDEEKNQILYLEQILTLIKSRGDVLIDECDTALAHNKELNYTIGQDPKPAPSYVISNTLRIYDLLDQVSIKPNADPAFTLEDVMLGRNVIVMDHDWEKALADLAKVLMDHPSGTLHFIKKENNGDILNYLLSQSSNIPACYKKYTSNERSLIDLVKGELGLFRLILSKKPGVDYGFPEADKKDFKGSKELAIPFFSNQSPNYRAKKSLYETMMLTVVLQKRRVDKDKTLTPLLIDRFIEDFMTRAFKELEDKSQVEDIQFFETTAARKFASITGLALSTISKESNRYQIISESKSAFNYVMQKYILNENKEHTKVLRMNRINHIAQSRSGSGISGTPWNVKAMHQRFEFDENSSIGIDGVTIAHLKSKKPAVDFLQTKDPAQIITHSVINHKDVDRIHAFIDIGAIFAGENNETIAKLFKDKFNERNDQNKIKHILFFDNKKGLCALPLDGSPTIVIGNTDAKVIDEKTKSTPAERFTYYDQAHTTGIDIRQTSDAIAVTTLDLESNARDCWQGVMRMRQLANNQTVTFWLPDKVKGNKHWNIDDVIDFVLGNQINKLAEIHLKAAIAKMDNIVREFLLNKVYSTKDVYEKIELRKRFANVFEVNLQSEPSIKFSGIEAVEDTDKILKSHLENNCASKLRALLIDESELAMLTQELNMVVEDALENCLPQSRYVAEADKEMELELEKEREKEKEKEKEKEEEAELYAPPIHNIPHQSWRKNFPTHFAENASYPVDMFPLHDMVGLDLGFSKDIYVSENFRNTYLDQKNKIDNYVKPLNFFLTIKDANGLLQTLCITQPEAKEFTAFLTDAKESNYLKSQGIEAWIMTPHNTRLCGTSSFISDPNQTYSELLAQLQYFNGDIDRMMRQQNFSWLLRENTLEKLDFLRDVLLKNHPEKAQSFSYFMSNINQFIAAKLQQVAAQSLDMKSIFEGIKNENTEEGMATVIHYLGMLDQLHDENLKKTVINFTTVKEDGIVFTPLDLAIKYNRTSIVQAFKASQALSLSPSAARSPILLAMEHRRIDLLKNQILNDANMYPPAGSKSNWVLLYDRVIASKNSEIIDLFLKMMKEKCDPKIINEIITEKTKSLVIKNFSRKDISTNIDNLLKLTSSSSEFYHSLFTQAKQEASPNNLVNLLMVLQDKGLDINALLFEIKRPDAIIQILEDPYYQSISDNLTIKQWSLLFDDALNPGSYLFLHEKETPQTSNSRPMLSIDLKNIKLNASFFALSHRTSGMYSKNKIEEQPEFINAFEQYRNELKRGKKKVFLQHDNIMLQFMRDNQHSIKPELLIYLLDKLGALSEAESQPILNNMSAAVLPQMIDKIFQNNTFNEDGLALLSSSRVVPLNNIEFWGGIFDKFETIKPSLLLYHGNHIDKLQNILVDIYVDRVTKSSESLAHFRHRLFNLIGTELRAENLAYYDRLASLNFADPKLHALGNILLKTFVEYSCTHPEKLDIIAKLFANGLVVSYQDMTSYIERLSNAHENSTLALWLAQHRKEDDSQYFQVREEYQENLPPTVKADSVSLLEPIKMDVQASPDSVLIDEIIHSDAQNTHAAVSSDEMINANHTLKSVTELDHLPSPEQLPQPIIQPPTEVPAGQPNLPILQNYVENLSLSDAQKNLVMSYYTQHVNEDSCQKLIELIKSVNGLSPAHLALPAPANAMHSDLQKEYDASILKVRDEIKALSAQLFNGPPKAAQREIAFLAEFAKDLSAFTASPSEHAKNRLITSSNAIYQKKGKIWAPLKTAVAGIIGIACIVVGVLGLVPSFGASVGLIAVGSLLCAAAGFTAVKKFLPPSMVRVKIASKDVSALISQARKLGSIAPLQKPGKNSLQHQRQLRK